MAFSHYGVRVYRLGQLILLCLKLPTMPSLLYPQPQHAWQGLLDSFKWNIVVSAVVGYVKASLTLLSDLTTQQ